MTVGVTGVPESRPVGQRSSVSGAPGAGGVSLSQAAVSSGAKPVYVALDAPCRVIDTRPGDSNIGPKSTPIGAGDAAAYTIQITGSNGDCTGPLTIPTDAVAVATNVTVIAPNGAPSGRSYFTVYPADATRPTTSNLNFVNGQAPTPNKVDVGLSSNGKITIYNNEGTAHAAVDVFGYYIDHTHDDRYYTKAQTYTKADVDGALAGKANTTDVYTKSQIDARTLTRNISLPALALNEASGLGVIEHVDDGLSWENSFSESADLFVRRPADWTGGGDVVLRLFFRRTNSAAGNVQFFTRPRDYDDGDPFLDSVPFSSDIQSEANTNLYEVIMTIPAAALPKDWWEIAIQRNSNVASPYPDPVTVLSIDLEYEART